MKYQHHPKGTINETDKEMGISRDGPFLGTVTSSARLISEKERLKDGRYDNQY